MSLVERFTRLAGAVLGVSSVLLILAGGILFYPAWFFAGQHQPFWALCWTAAGIAFVAYGVVSVLDLTRRMPAPAMDLMRPLLKLGAIALALAGAAWALHTEIRRQQTGDFEAYGVVIGLVMAVHGVAAFWWLEQPRRGAASEAGTGR